MNLTLFRLFPLLVVLALLTACGSSDEQEVANDADQPDPAGGVAGNFGDADMDLDDAVNAEEDVNAPVEDVPELEAGFNKSVKRAGRFIIAGRPLGQTALLEASEQGVSLVIDAHTDDMDFDEEMAAAELGLTYVRIPVQPDTLTRADVDELARAIGTADNGILIHCNSSNRSSGLWAAWLALHRDMSVEDALARARETGLRKPAMEDAVRRVAGE